MASIAVPLMLDSVCSSGWYIAEISHEEHSRKRRSAFE
jgi:hypothetical protein